MLFKHIHGLNNDRYNFSTYHQKVSGTHFNDLFGDTVDNISYKKPIMPHRGFFQKKSFKYGYYYVKNGIHYILDRFGVSHMIMRSHVCDFAGIFSTDGSPIYTGDILNDEYLVAFNAESGSIVGLIKDADGVYSEIMIPCFQLAECHHGRFTATGNIFFD